MKEIYYLIFGIILATVGNNLLNCVTEILVSLTELFRAFIGVQIMKCNSTIDRLDTNKKNPIGFAVSNEEERNG